VRGVCSSSNPISEEVWGGQDDKAKEFRPAAGFPRCIAGGFQLPISSFDVATACYRDSGLGWLGIPSLVLLPRSVYTPLVERDLPISQPL